MKFYLVICLFVTHFSFCQKKQTLYYAYTKDTLKNDDMLTFINDSVAQFRDGIYPMGVRHYQLNILYKNNNNVITLTNIPVTKTDSLELLRGYWKLPATLYYKDEILVDEANNLIYVDYKKFKDKNPITILDGKQCEGRKLKRILKTKDFDKKYILKTIHPYEAYQKFGIRGINGAINIIPKQEN